MRRLNLSRPFRVAASFCAGCCLLLSVAAPLVAQSAAGSINNELHHKRLLYTNDLRLWDVTIPPGEATQPFVHEYDLATVVIADGALTIQRNGETVAPAAPNARGSVVVADHSGAPATYRIDNQGTTGYRAFEIENMREGNFPASTPFTAAGASVLRQSRAFTIYDLVLKGGAAEVVHEHTGSTIVVLLEGSLQQGGIGGTDPVRLQQLGQWLVIPRFQTHAVMAAGSGDAHAIEIEVR